MGSGSSLSTFINYKNQQCIAVSGESGAGKTESTKLIVQHIIQLCRNDLDKELQKKIIEVNIVINRICYYLSHEVK